MWFYLLIFSSLLLLYWWKNNVALPHPNFPPGPIGLPFLGNLGIFFEENILIAFENLHKKYGKVLSVNIGPTKCVVIGDLKLLKEALSGEKANSRPPSLTELRFGNGTGEFFINFDSRH